MRDFLTYNSLGIFSLVILSIVFYQANKYLETDNTKLKKIWISAICATFFVQLLDIFCRLMTHESTTYGFTISYISHLVLFNFIVIMSCNFALFIDYSIEFSDRAYKSLRKLFNIFILINIIFSLISIPFVMKSKPYFQQEILLIITAVISYLPLFFVLLRVLFRRKESIKILTLTGIVFPLLFAIMQIKEFVPISLTLPSITTFILIMNSLLTINSMYIDHLTGLKNTRGIQKYFSDLPQSLNCYLTVIFIDINEFKLLNDKYGHTEGDLALCAISRVLSKNLRTEDLVGRIGGDEFIIATKLQRPNSVDFIIDGINNDLIIYNDSTNKPYRLSISYGIASNPPNIRINKELLICEADRKMYAQKAKKYKTLGKEAL